jgi:5-aminopentanamidase
MDGDLTVALYQTGTAGLVSDDRWRARLRHCADRGVDLLVTPEFAIGGLSHTAGVARERSLRGPAQPLAYVRETVPDLTVVLGYVEQTESGLHSSAAVTRNTTLIATARKVRPREPGLVAGPAPANGWSGFEVAGVRCGIVIGSDVRHPEVAAAFAAGDVRLLVCPLNNDLSLAGAARWRVPTERALSARPRETGCWLVSADVAGHQPGRTALAVTRVVAPDGTEYARSEPAPDELLIVDLPVVAG